MMDERLQRNECGFLEVRERPSPEELSHYYAQSYYQQERSGFRHSYSDAELKAIHLRIEQRAAKAMELLGDSRPGRLLDVGCGEGFVLSAFKRRGFAVTGFDYSMAGVLAMNPEIAGEVVQGDVIASIESALADEHRFDLIWLGNVLEHVLNPADLLASVKKLLVPDGILVATVPNDGSIYQETLLRQGAIDRRFWITVPDHLSYFTAESLRALAEKTGYGALEIMGDFPIDLFLAHPGSNYVQDPEQGPPAHAARIWLESLIGSYGVEAANRFYSALAGVGLGRNLTAYFRPLAAKEVP